MNLENSSATAFCSSQWAQIMIKGVEEIVGPEDALSIVSWMQQEQTDSAVLLNQVPLVHAALQEMYGSRGGQGVALRAGRVAFNALLRQKGVQMGMFSSQFRLLPTPARIRLGLEALAEQIGLLWNEKVTLGEDNSHWIWRTEHCPLSPDLHTTCPACYFTVGFLQGFIAWTTGGKNYLIHEAECVAAGHPACVLLINRLAVEG